MVPDQQFEFELADAIDHANRSLLVHDLGTRHAVQNHQEILLAQHNRSWNKVNNCNSCNRACRVVLSES